MLRSSDPPRGGRVGIRDNLKVGLPDLPKMRLALAILLVLAMPTASAAPDHVHLGIPSAAADAARSVVWHETAAPRESWTVTLEGPEGPREVEARVVEGPSLGTVYEAVFEGLAPNTTYQYAIDERRFEFTMPPAAPTALRPIRIVALGDMGTSERAIGTVEAIADLAPDLILHAGDISYAEGRQNEWAAWFAMVEPVAASILWITALGNHETYTGASLMGLTGIPSQVEIDHYLQRFSLPADELLYGFDQAGIHVLALDTFSTTAIRPDAAALAEEDLAGAQSAAWRIAFLHEPPYSSNDHGSSERVQRAYVPALEAGGVDLVLAAHDHGYERSKPQNGVTYVVSGGGGESLYTNWEEPAPAWSEFRDAKYHVTVLDVYPDRIEGRTVGTNGDTLEDTFTLFASTDGTAPAAILTNDTPALTWLAAVAILSCVALLRRR